MSQIFSNGGPAFPRPNSLSPQGDTEWGDEGMTVRAWLAGQAITGLLSFSGSIDGDTTKTPEKIADMATLYADALIERLNHLP